jgi:hypothetical protein
MPGVQLAIAAPFRANNIDGRVVDELIQSDFKLTSDRSQNE